MITSVAVDKQIRDKAAQRARKDKLSVSAVVRILLLDYAAGKIDIGTRVPDDLLIETIEVDKNTQELMDKVVETWRNK